MGCLSAGSEGCYPTLSKLKSLKGQRLSVWLILSCELAWSLLIYSGERGSVEPVRISSATLEKGEGDMLWTILVVLLVLWLIGLIAHIGGALIHLLLVVALIVFVINLLTGRRTV